MQNLFFCQQFSIFYDDLTINARKNGENSPILYSLFFVRFPTGKGANRANKMVQWEGLDNIYQSENMKFKKQCRWLMFLLVPFVVLMILLFMVPLEFVLNARPLATQHYNAQKAEMQQFPVRASVVALAQKLSNQLTDFNRLIYLFLQAQKSQRFVSVDVGKINIANAQIYYQNFKSSPGRKENASMWFSTNIQTVGALKSSQLAAYNQYVRFQPYVRSHFFSGDDRGLVGIYAFYKCATEGDLVFHFPAYVDTQYKQTDSVVNSSLYESAVTNYAKTNSTVVTVVDYSNSLIDGPLLLVCQLILASSKSDPAKGVFCLKLDLSILSDSFMNDLVNEASPNQAYDFLSLMSPILSQDKGSRILSNISLEYPKIQALFPVNQFYTIPGLSPKSLKQVFQSGSLFSKPRSQSYRFYRVYDQLYYIIPIYLPNPQTNYYSSAIYVLMHTDFKVLGFQLESSNINANTLNTLLIPIIIVMILSTIISILVLRSLLNNLEQELFKLNEQCNFILQGDIEIEIPEFKGAKDIAEVYQQVRIINKLHKYTSKDYFVGHFSNKILKYNEALQVIRKLNYDTSYLLEGIGEAYLFIEQFEKSLFFLKQSVRMLEEKMEKEFGSLDYMLQLKQQKEKIPMAYRQMEIVMIRRLWKLIFTSFKYVDLQAINSKNMDDELLSEQQKQQKKERLQRETAEYISKMKKVMYPDFKSYAECVVLLCFEINMYLNIKNLDAARNGLPRCNKIAQLYAKQYDLNTKKLKEKGSKNLYFFKKNRLTGHSRASPNILLSLNGYIRALIHIQDPKSRDYYAAVCLLFEALKMNINTQTVGYLIFNQLKKLFATLKISMDKLSTMQLFHQTMPYKTLYYGPLTKQVEATLYRMPKVPVEVESREFIFFLDSSQIYISEKLLNDQIQHIIERSTYVFDKLVKKFDRVSIVQSSQSGLITHCNLTLKEGNETILKKSLTDMMQGLNYCGQNELIQSLETLIFRVKLLQCEKVLFFFLKHMDSYAEERKILNRPKQRSRTKSKRKTQQTQKSLTENQSTAYLHDIGESIENLIANSSTRNLKLILICAQGDDYSKVIDTFGLKDINRRIWAKTEGLNRHNNLVYIIDDKHKSDFDRILMSKLANVPDNHVFAL